jgi:hypothetical protein
VVLAGGEPERYRRAAVRWLGRLLLVEGGISLAEVQLCGNSTNRAPAAGARHRGACRLRGLLRGAAVGGSASTLTELVERSTP